MVPADDVITFPEGVVGLEHLRAFALVEDPRIVPCRWLQSLEELEIAFVVVDPRIVDPGYAIGALGDADAGPLDMLAIITLSPEPDRSTVNLLAPVVVDPKTRAGRQLVLHESGYSLRHPIGSPPAPTGNEDARPSA